ncbi:MAG: hypothetical protein V8R83_08780 [Candidatus Gastranaerophilaceae bacterium]
MVQGVGPTGNNSGSMSDIYLYNMYKNEWETYRKNHPESSMSFEDYLQMKGYLNYFNQQVENYVETGSTLQGDGQSGNTLAPAEWLQIKQALFIRVKTKKPITNLIMTAALTAK